MTKINCRKRAFDHSDDTNEREIAARGDMARRGYRLMHRRNGQYWVVLDQPMTLDEIDRFLFNEIEVLAKAKELDQPHRSAVSLAKPDRLRVAGRAYRRMSQG